MIKIRNLRVEYDSRAALAVQQLDLSAGQFALLVGPTGSGKSTLLGAIAGLVPEYTGGRLIGSLQVAGREVAGPVPEVGMVLQRPYEGFVQQTVAAEVGFSLRQLPLAEGEINERVTGALEEVGLGGLRDADLDSLSDGEAQRVAIAAAIVVEPAVLLLDEPTSALDAVSADQLLQLLVDINRERGTTILVSEHRFDRLLPLVDTVVDLAAAGRAVSPRDFAAAADPAPKLIRLCRLAGSDALPLTASEAKPHLDGLRGLGRAADQTIVLSTRSAVASFSNVTVAVDDVNLISEVSIELPSAAATAVLGASGAGKSTLLHALIGDIAPRVGEVKVGVRAPHRLGARQLLGRIALVPQQPADLFIADTVADECRLADRRRRLPIGSTQAQLLALGDPLTLDQHPRDLSAGQQLQLALAIAIAADPELLLLDEPTRGLDPSGRRALAELVANRVSNGKAVVFATHDLELAADLAQHLVVMADGGVVSAGPPSAACHPLLAIHSLTNQALAPSDFLSVNQVALALTGGE